MPWKATVHIGDDPNSEMTRLYWCPEMRTSVFLRDTALHIAREMLPVTAAEAEFPSKQSTPWKGIAFVEVRAWESGVLIGKWTVDDPDTNLAPPATAWYRGEEQHRTNHFRLTKHHTDCLERLLDEFGVPRYQFNKDEAAPRYVPVPLHERLLWIVTTLEAWELEHQEGEPLAL